MMHDNDAPTQEPILSKSALNHIWSLESNGRKVLEGPLSLRWEYFDHASKLFNDPKDIAAKNVLTKAILAEQEDPEPKEDYA